MTWLTTQRIDHLITFKGRFLKPQPFINTFWGVNYWYFVQHHLCLQLWHVWSLLAAKPGAKKFQEGGGVGSSLWLLWIHFLQISDDHTRNQNVDLLVSSHDYSTCSNPRLDLGERPSQRQCANYEMVKSEAMCAPFNIYQLLDACQYLFVPCPLVYSWHE